MMVSVSVKWGKVALKIELQNPHEYYIAELKQELYCLTEVLPERQKLIFKGKNFKDDTPLSEYIPDFKKHSEQESAAADAQASEGGHADGTGPSLNFGPIMMMGPKESDLEAILNPPEVDDVIDDFDVGSQDEAGVFQIKPDDMRKCERRIAQAERVIEVRNRGRNDPKSGLASPNHTANLSGLVLGCIEAEFFKWVLILQHFSSSTHFAACVQIYKICTFLYRLSRF